MVAKRESVAASKPAQLSWAFAADVPTNDLLETYNLDDMGDLGQAVEDFLFVMDGGEFLAWEAVMCAEQSLPMTAAQQEVLGGLMSFEEKPGNRVSYLNDLPRPSAPWYATLNAIVPHLLVESFDTRRGYYGVQSDGWARLMEAVGEHAGELSLPEGVESPEEVVPADLRRRLWVHYFLEILGGLGQEGVEPLENAPWRVDEVLLRLREHAESVRRLRLTLEGLLERVSLPARDRDVFVRLMSEALGLASTSELLAEKL